MSNTTSVLLETGTAYPARTAAFISSFVGEVCVVHLLRFLCYVFCFVCLRSVSYVQYCILGLSNFLFTIRDPLMFSYVNISNRRIDIQ
jgi:hypothetical protein